MSRLTDQQKADIFAMRSQGFSSRAIASAVLGSSTKKSTVNDLISREESTNAIQAIAGRDKPNILVIDVETAPEIGYFFRRFKAFIAPEQVIKRGYLLSYSAVGLDDGDEVIGRNLTSYNLFEIDHTDDYELCLELWDLLDEADVVIAHNGQKFDRAYINQRFAYHELPPPSNYVVIDTLRAAKKQFALPSNALKEICMYFETENFKLENEGFPLWKACCEGDENAFQRMQTYNDGDVVSLRDVYRKLLPWIPQHPNVAAYYKDSACRCPRCGSTEVSVVKDKFYNTGVSTFEILRCSSCNGLSRARVNLRTKEKRVNTIIGV